MRLSFLTAFAASVLTLSAASAETLDLNGIWDFRFERDRTLEEVARPDFTANDRMCVPGCWDVLSRYFNQRGTGLYRTRFNLAEPAKGAFLVVEQCGLRSRYWLDGREIGFSVKPWNRLEFKTGPLAAGSHELVAALDSTYGWPKTKLFQVFYDFYCFGGFYHGVSLDLRRAENEIRKVYVRTRDYRTGLVELEVEHAENGPADFTASVAFDGGAATAVAFKNRRAQIAVPKFRLWSPESPNLHAVSVDGVRTRFGIRQVGTAQGRITLNGEPIYLQGVNRHEAHVECGSATPRQVMLEDVMNMKDIGCNFVRGAHYQQCPEFLDLCDEFGLLVWEESLGWGNRPQELGDPEFMRLQVEQTRDMVRASLNHPSVIISAFLNEPASDTPAGKQLIERLVRTIRAEDTGHLVTYACMHPKSSLSYDTLDVISYNVYPCWYVNTMTKGTDEEAHANIRACHDDIVRTLRKKHPSKPIIVSETGVKADWGVRDPRGRAQYSEDYQAWITRTTLEELFANKELAGVALWQFTDAKSYTVVGGICGRPYGVNTGGLYDLYRRPKMAVDVVRELYVRHRSVPAVLFGDRPQ